MGKKTIQRRNFILAEARRLTLAASYSFLTLVVSISIAWVVLAKQDFYYGVWHDYGGIKQGIDTYGPQNRYKKGFGETSREERLRVFAAINSAVHEGGAGLAQISYHSSSLESPQQMLTEPEVVHLQDVANLIDKLVLLAMAAAVFWLGVCAYLLLVSRAIPPLRQQLQGLAICLVPVFLSLVIIGPTTVFNTLHVWIFPDDHQWFFYYQESLMSTLMLAPRLFAWIAAAMGLVALAVYALLQTGLYLLVARIRAL